MGEEKEKEHRDTTYPPTWQLGRRSYIACSLMHLITSLQDKFSMDSYSRLKWVTFRSWWSSICRSSTDSWHVVPWPWTDIPVVVWGCDGDGRSQLMYVEPCFVAHHGRWLCAVGIAPFRDHRYWRCRDVKECRYIVLLGVGIAPWFTLILGSC